MVQAHQVGHAVGHRVDADHRVAGAVHQPVDQAGHDARRVVGGMVGLQAHGQVVCYGSNALQQTFEYRPWLFHSLGVKFFLVYELTPADRQQAIAKLTALLEQEALQHSIGPRFTLDQMVQAHLAVEAGQSIGNVVVDIAQV